MALPTGIANSRQQATNLRCQYRNLELIEAGISGWIYEPYASAAGLPKYKAAHLSKCIRVLNGREDLATLILPVDVYPHRTPNA